ncbi:hypothetical protein T265_15544, partial [Opisthorchis viverrini]
MHAGKEEVPTQLRTDDVSSYDNEIPKVKPDRERDNLISSDSMWHCTLCQSGNGCELSCAFRYFRGVDYLPYKRHVQPVCMYFEKRRQFLRCNYPNPEKP